MCTEDFHLFVHIQFEIRALLVTRMGDQTAVVSPAIAGDFSQGSECHGGQWHRRARRRRMNPDSCSFAFLYLEIVVGI